MAKVGSGWFRRPSSWEANTKADVRGPSLPYAVTSGPDWVEQLRLPEQIDSDVCEELTRIVHDMLGAGCGEIRIVRGQGASWILPDKGQRPQLRERYQGPVYIEWNGESQLSEAIHAFIGKGLEEGADEICITTPEARESKAARGRKPGPRSRPSALAEHTLS